MDLEDSNEEENIDLLDLANNILAVLNFDNQISEEDLFSDEFYILVFSSLMSDEEEIKLEPGKTPEEKIENLNLILEALRQLFKDELPPINAKKIIKEKDQENVKALVEVFFGMIQMLIKENLKLEEEKGDTDEEIKSHSFNDDNKMNLSEKKATEKMRRNKDEEINLENLESLRLGKDKDKKKEEKKDIENKEEKIINTDDNKNEDEIDDVNINIKNSSNKKKQDIEIESSHESLEKENNTNEINIINNNKDLEKESEEGKLDNIEDNNDNKKSVEIDISENSSAQKNYKKKLTDSEEKPSGKKKSNDIPNLLDEKEEKEEKENIIQKAKNQFEDIKLSEQEDSDSRFNNSEKRKAHSVSQSLPKLYNPNPEDENEIDLENYNDGEENDFDYDYNPDKNSKKESESNSNINIENSSQKKNIDDNDNDNDDIDNIDNNSKSIQQTSEKKKDTNKNTSSKKKEITSSKKKSSNKKGDIDLQKSKKKELSEKKEISEKKENQESGQKDIINPEEQPEQKISQGQEEENEEEPLIEEEYRNEIMKQFKKIYGDKLDNIFLKHNLQNSRGVFELALRNIKLAKQKMLKIENRLPEVDDLKTKEYILRYEKERQLMEAYYNKEHKKINYFEERAINNFKQNMKDSKKAKEIEARKTENEIERRRKAQEVRNYHNQVKFCNEIYHRALELEKEKKIEKMKKKREENRKENEEKRAAMERIENYYKDQIRLLREILENEKKQKEIEHRAHIQFLATFAKEKRDEYRKELDNIFDKFEQEEKRNEFERKNKKELNKIFDSYYGK